VAYAIFYIFLIFSDLNINYVENIIDLNLENLKAYNFENEAEKIENTEK